MRTTWRELIEVGPRFMGTEGARRAVDFIKQYLHRFNCEVSCQEFSYLRWSEPKKPSLEILSPIKKALTCCSFVYSPSTHEQGIEGGLEYLVVVEKK